MVAFLETDEAKTRTMHQRDSALGIYQPKTRIHK